MPEHTTNLTKTPAGRFWEGILAKNRWNLSFCDFSSKNLSIMKLKVLARTLSYEKLPRWHSLVVSYSTNFLNLAT